MATRREHMLRLNADPAFIARMRKIRSKNMARLNADPKFKKAVRKRTQERNADPLFKAEYTARLARMRLDPDIMQKNRLACSMALTDRNKARAIARKGTNVRYPHLAKLTVRELLDYRVLRRKGYKMKEALVAVGRADLVQP